MTEQDAKDVLLGELLAMAGDASLDLAVRLEAVRAVAMLRGWTRQSDPVPVLPWIAPNASQWPYQVICT